MSLGMIFLLNGATNIFCFAAGYYLSHRGFVGVKSDLADVAMDVKNIKNKIKPVKV